MAGKHDCFDTNGAGYLVYICSFCEKCYVCKHEFRFFEQEEKWKVKCRKVWRDIILDGRLKA